MNEYEIWHDLYRLQTSLPCLGSADCHLFCIVSQLSYQDNFSSVGDLIPRSKQDINPANFHQLAIRTHTQTHSASYFIATFQPVKGESHVSLTREVRTSCAHITTTPALKLLSLHYRARYRSSGGFPSSPTTRWQHGISNFLLMTPMLSILISWAC